MATCVDCGREAYYVCENCEGDICSDCESNKYFDVDTCKNEEACAERCDAKAVGQ